MPSPDLLTSKILIVDDEPANLDLLIGCLQDDGYQRLISTQNPREVVDLYESERPDLILLDLHMPGLNGFEVMAQLGERVPAEEYLPILVLTADITETTKQRALSGGAKDFLTKPIDLTESLLRIGNLLHTRWLHQQQRLGRLAAEKAERRALFLARASHLLATSLDHATALSLLCRSIVPELADYCVVEVLNEDDSVSRIALAHVDPAKEPLLQQTADPSLIPSEHPVMAALRHGRRTLASEITPAMRAAVAANDDHRRIIDELGPRSLISVPILGGGRIHGALVLAQSESNRRFDMEDLELVGELARRAGLTIENARLFEQAQGAMRARDELLAIVAHDLRNPLSTVKMGSAMLLEEATTEPQRRHAELVDRAADRMHRLVEDLMDVTRIESGKLRIELTEAKLGPIIAEAVATLKPLAESNRISLTSKSSPDLPPVTMDSSRIMQVLSNLVGNALKFTPPDGRVEIACEAAGDDVRVSVADNGSGIAPEQLPHVFGRLWQASDRDSRGLGLGLSIVHGLVRAHGGSVWVESELGKGTTFYFTIPTVRPQADESTTSEEAEAGMSTGMV